MHCVHLVVCVASGGPSSSRGGGGSRSPRRRRAGARPAQRPAPGAADGVQMTRTSVPQIFFREGFSDATDAASAVWVELREVGGTKARHLSKTK